MTRKFLFVFGCVCLCFLLSAAPPRCADLTLPVFDTTTASCRIFGVSGDYSDSDSSDGKSSQLDDTVPLVGGTFFVSLTCTDVRDLIETGKMWVLAEGASVVELRVDLLASWDHDFVRNQTALLRRSCTYLQCQTRSARSTGFPQQMGGRREPNHAPVCTPSQVRSL
jgi:hypothetical protein